MSHSFKVRTPPLSILCSTLIFSVFTLSGCGKSASVPDMIKEAQSYQAQGKDQSAIIQLKNALQKDPGNIQARTLLGSIYLNTGNLAAAEDELHRVLQSGNSGGKVEETLGQAYLARGEFQKIIDEIQPNPSSPPDQQAGVWILRGDGYLGLNDLTHAQTAFDTALKLAPKDVQAQRGQARFLLAQGKTDEATQLIDQITQTNPNDATAWIMKGDLLRSHGAPPEKVLSTYQQALVADPKSGPALASLASLYLTMGKIDQAEAEVNTYNKVLPNSLMGKYLQALIDYGNKRYLVAQDDLDTVMKSSPDFMPAILLRGLTALQLTHYEEAQKDLSRFVETFPKNDYARKILARIELKEHQPQEALKTLTPLLGTEQTDPETNALAAQIYTDSGDFEKASQVLALSAQKNPQNAVLRTQLALTLLATGQENRAISDLEAASKLDPNYLQADNALALTYLGNKNYDKALKYIQLLINKNPKNPNFYNLQGAAYIGLGNWANAQTSFTQALALDPAYSPAALNLAQISVKKHDIPGAQKTLESVLSHDRKNLQAMEALAGLAALQGQEQTYVDWLKKASVANPSALTPDVELIGFYLQKKQEGAALDQAQAAVTANPNNAMAMELLAETQLKSGKNKDAVATYGKIVEMNPKSSPAYFRLAMAQSLSNDSEGAITSLNKAHQLQPENLDILNRLAGLELAAGNYTEAQSLAENYQRSHPKSPEGAILEGDTAFQQKHYDAAIAAYAQAQKVLATTVGEIKLDNALTQSGKTQEADQHIRRWLALHPNDLVSRNYLAARDLTENNDKSAIEQYQYLLQKTPNNPIVLNNLAYLYLETHNPQALATAQKAYQLAPRNPNIEDTLGWIYTRQGNPQKGLELLKPVATQMPDALDIQYHYAEALIQTGNKDQGRRILEELVNSPKDFPQKNEAKASLSHL
ncbi:MAG: PEP-CTERM system TPR-repeat protein PrsT [Ferrovum myxofaciens]|uniref:XrtA/PEP-CTERM system TPR-repeat protein PrsT n=1 Tax=Ferrovum myxofaciens TaxID=416213 RepID=UPI0023523075|nr:XrtA/PEP-CTERM system TPR-repeat protein PrsT [Ferrovum myxofaciens]QKE41673.1 MAG: PEP-CTERM system TPR-repeat protein PrsT [Ferrovum myxofaciens]